MRFDPSPKHLLLLLLVACLTVFKTPASAQVNIAKPWTYWWWMGSAVNDKDIEHSLKEFKRVGIGGVHIIPIYGVKGYEDQFKPFLGDKWMKALAFTMTEAKKLNLGVDLSTGTGWPFGGPNVSQANSAKRWIYKNNEFLSVSTQQKVKRPAPGGQGYVVDPFDKDLMRSYLGRFDSAFAKKDISLRSMYCDSYEVYGANWTDHFLDEFKRRRGYDLRSVAAIFTDTANTGREATLIRMDYQQTLSELLYDTSEEWATWSTRHHMKTRYQAHGAPGNILDLYSLASIPETEAFGSSNFNIPLLRVEPDYSPAQFGRPNPLMMKFASSEAGVSGKQLISSETCTWLANHFKESLSQVKPQVDELFAGGINHVFFHGTAYSPQAEKYPGWLFYATTNFGPTSHFYNEFPLLNQYIYNCQTILQNSKPDNDVLIYFPIQDIWGDKNGGPNGIHQLDVHHSDNWFLAHPFGKICQQLAKGGFSFDYISDKQLNDLKVNNHQLQAAGSTYKVLVIPHADYLPKATMERLIALGKQGATIIFDHDVPQSPMGYGNFKENSIAFEKDKAIIAADKVHFPVTNDLESELKQHRASQEMLPGAGLSFIRKRQHGKAVYFITNLSNKFTSGWITLSAGVAGHLSGYDPLNKQHFNFAARKTGGKAQLYLSLLPGGSCFIMEGAAIAPTVAAPRNYEAYQISNPWQLQFMEGRPAYHQSFKLDTLQSWTALSDTASFFTGTAKYTATIKIPAKVSSKKDLVIDLGTVNESATVKINGKFVGTAWSIPFRLNIPQGVLLPGENKLEIAVTNVSANYMRLYDKEHPEWKKFYDANIVDISYKPFSAAKWAIMPSGLSTNNLKILYR